jgi:transcriptional regulator with XRE-family HTH domain
METLGERLAAVRKKMGGLTQKEFGELVKVTPTTVGNYENNSRIPDWEYIQKVVKLSGVTYEWLSDGIGSIEDKAGQTKAAAAPNNAFVDAIMQSNSNLNFMIGMLADKVRSLGGDLPPGLGKLKVFGSAESRPIIPMWGTNPGTDLAHVG